MICSSGFYSSQRRREWASCPWSRWVRVSSPCSGENLFPIHRTDVVIDGVNYDVEAISL